MYGCEFVIRLALGAEYIGVCNFSWLLYGTVSRVFFPRIRRAAKQLRNANSFTTLLPAVTEEADADADAAAEAVRTRSRTRSRSRSRGGSSATAPASVSTSAAATAAGAGAAQDHARVRRMSNELTMPVNLHLATTAAYYEDYSTDAPSAATNEEEEAEEVDLGGIDLELAGGGNGGGGGGDDGGGVSLEFDGALTLHTAHRGADFDAEQLQLQQMQDANKSTKTPLSWFDYVKYVWSTIVTLGSVLIICYGISIQAYVLPIPPVGAYILALCMLVCLFYLEGQMIAIVGTQYWDPEQS